MTAICSAASGRVISSDARRDRASAARASRSPVVCGSVVAIRHAARSGPSISIGLISDAAAAATTAPAPVSTQPNARRSPRYASHTPAAAPSTSSARATV